MYINKILNKQLYGFSNKQQFIEMFIYSAVCFFLPLFIGHPQIVVGITVNALLIMSALNLPRYKLLPIVILPSLGVLSRGLIFGPFTIYLVYMIPFIWLGNFILVYLFKSLYLDKKVNYLFTLLVSAGAKSLFLFLAAFVLFKLEIIPVIFLTAMGIIQFVTAFSAGFFAFGVSKVQKKVFSSNENNLRDHRPIQ